MRQVAFMDSSGINILIAVHQAVTAAGGWLRLADPAGSVMRTSPDGAAQLQLRARP
ncbi:STAS domain-containing protein [Streptomyces sp. NPDC007907]|uniref:STAS domain-containing protein n=1 Tax=Streptomyces sp. NPDC007907 TaxID=3364789 RepID=UPI0036F0598C